MSATANKTGDGGPHQSSTPTTANPLLPLVNLSNLSTNITSLRHVIATSLTSPSSISTVQIHSTSSQLVSAVHLLISHSSALISTVHPPNPNPPSDPTRDENGDVTEIDAAELMADHVHTCEICGKGFKRDANLRMHMRAHGLKTPQALAKPDPDPNPIPTRFSCPVPGCGRNKAHKRFRALKTVACVKSHFKRSHCPKTFGCEKCGKGFAVAGDLRSHVRSCGGGNGGERKWRCSCGTSFSRKDKLFGHVACFEGHSPAVNAEKEGEKEGLDPEFFDGLMEEIDNFGIPYM